MCICVYACIHVDAVCMYVHVCKYDGVYAHVISWCAFLICSIAMLTLQQEMSVSCLPILLT